MKNIIETKNLNYSFGKFKVLHNVNLQVPEKSIYGFLGPNGAGKTTTIRILLNLISVSKEKVYVIGNDIAKSRNEVLGKTGSLVEMPSLYKHLTAVQNLEVHRRLTGSAKKSIEEVLEIVSLTADKDRKVKEYSLGMCQRLGIALALLNDPELLILDEPVNGLDPKGIVEIRELLQLLNQQYGKTIFISSHLLAEIDKLVTHVGLINHGQIHFQGSIEEFRSLNKPKLELEVDDQEKAAELLKKESFLVNRINGSKLEVKLNNYEETSGIIRNLVYNEVNIFEAKANKNEIENLFLELTQN